MRHDRPEGLIMCGLAGFWTARRIEDPSVVLRRMTGAISHRGPDGEGCWFDATCGVALGHRRLAILDLSPAGHQPMASESRRYTIAFNGEVYNFEELRQELGGKHWRGHSDTEVMLAAFEAWGVEKAVQRFVGMFAFAVWDSREHRLYLVRDRVGIKPLYFGWCAGTLLFGSELKALREHDDFDAGIEQDSVALLLRYGYIPTPYTIFQGIYKLEPGTIAAFSGPHRDCLTTTKYWSAHEVALQGLREPFTGGEEDAIAELDTLLRDAVRLRMIADVPLGAFLSGGIDSSLVVALMQAASAGPVKSYTIGFEPSGYDEAADARAVAGHLRTDHTEQYLTTKEVLETIPALPRLYDEPFADASQIPTLLVSQLARRHVTVALSGDGGDELFAGYNRHIQVENVARINHSVPYGLRSLLGKGIRAVPARVWDSGFGVANLLLPPSKRIRTPAEKVYKLAQLLSLDGPERLYQAIVSCWADPSSVAPGLHEREVVMTNPAQALAGASAVSQMMYLDLVSYLPDGVLTKLDRASMAVSLESRVPLLDHRVIEFAWRLPLKWKLRGGQGKWILRRVLEKYVPKALFDRPKMGFTFPVGEWLAGPLRDWAEGLLDEGRLQREGLFNARLIHRIWSEHLAGRGDWQKQLWCVLMFQAWSEEQRSTQSTACPMELGAVLQSASGAPIRRSTEKDAEHRAADNQQHR